MALEERIGPSVDAALTDLAARIDQEIRASVADLIRRSTLEAEQNTQLQVAEGEARARKVAESEAELRHREAAAAAESRLKLALAEADAKATQTLNDRLNDARAREREAAMAALNRLLDSIRNLDGATSLSEVLDSLAQAATREASRIAVLVLRHDRLLGWKLSGFGDRDAQPKSLDLGLTECGVIGLAVGAARPATTRDSHGASAGPGFAHLPADRMGFAVPVIVGGRVVAVVYADSVSSEGHDQTVPSGWPEVIEVLARHAARCLEALTVQKTASSAPRFWVPARPAQSPSTAQSNSASGSPTQASAPDATPGVSA